MPTWSNEIPETDTHRGFELLRTPADRTIQAVVTCDNLVGCFTHFWWGRTLPCEGQACPACKENMSARWHAYVSAFDPKSHNHFLFEFTAKAAPSFKIYYDAHGTLRGCHFAAHRPKRRKNSKIVIQCKPVDLSKLTIPEAPDLTRALSVIWTVPANALPESKAIDGHPTVDPDSDVFDKMNGRGQHLQPTTPIPTGDR